MCHYNSWNKFHSVSLLNSNDVSPKKSIKNSDIILFNGSGSWTAGHSRKTAKLYNYKIIHITRSKYHWPIIWISGPQSAREIIAYFLSQKKGTFLYLREKRNEWSCSFLNAMNVHSHLYVSAAFRRGWCFSRQRKHRCQLAAAKHVLRSIYLFIQFWIRSVASQ